MSVNRENVIWKSRDGTWNRGFFDFHNTGDPGDPDWDFEWDVEYDLDRFNWASTGWATENQAYQSWQGANPGGSNVYHEPSETTDTFDKMAKELRDTHRQKGWWQWPSALELGFVDAIQ